MKKGVLNYSITWTENGRNIERIIFSKLDTIAEYIMILQAPGRRVSSLKVWEIYTTPKPAGDITDRINRFLS